MPEEIEAQTPTQLHQPMPTNERRKSTRHIIHEFNRLTTEGSALEQLCSD